jgi:hypothetical protein
MMKVASRSGDVTQDSSAQDVRHPRVALQGGDRGGLGRPDRYVAYQFVDRGR